MNINHPIVLAAGELSDAREQGRVVAPSSNEVGLLLRPAFIYPRHSRFARLGGVQDSEGDFSASELSVSSLHQGES